MGIFFLTSNYETMNRSYKVKKVTNSVDNMVLVYFINKHIINNKSSIDNKVKWEANLERGNIEKDLFLCIPIMFDFCARISQFFLIKIQLIYHKIHSVNVNSSLIF